MTWQAEDSLSIKSRVTIEAGNVGNRVSNIYGRISA